MKSQFVAQLNKSWSAITFGCWQIAPSAGWGNRCSSYDAESIVSEALDCGITAFDTAEGYGDGESERRLGKALRSKKDDVIIISKILPTVQLSKDSFIKRLDRTLFALNRDYVDVYLLHGPEYFESQETIKNLVDCMYYLQSTGKARLIGISNFQLTHLKKIGVYNLSHFFINQVPYSLLQTEYSGATADYCKNSNLLYMAYSPTSKGLLARNMNKDALKFHARRNDINYSKSLYPHAKKVFKCVQKIAMCKDCLPIAISLAWVLEQQNILTAIVGSCKPGQIIEAVQATKITLTSSDLKKLDIVSQDFQKKRHAYVTSKMR